MFLFVVFAILFVGGIWAMGISFELDAWQGPIFIAGLLVFCLAWAIIIHRPGNEKKIGR